VRRAASGLAFDWQRVPVARVCLVKRGGSGRRSLQRPGAFL